MHCEHCEHCEHCNIVTLCHCNIVSMVNIGNQWVDEPCKPCNGMQITNRDVASDATHAFPPLQKSLFVVRSKIWVGSFR